MLPGQAPLEVDRIGGADGAVGAELDAAALDEGPGGHDDLALIAGHVPGNGGGEAVHRSGGLDALAEGQHGRLAAQLHRLDDVAARLPGGGDAAEAQTLVERGGEDGSLQSPGGDSGGQEEALVEGG